MEIVATYPINDGNMITFQVESINTNDIKEFVQYRYNTDSIKSNEKMYEIHKLSEGTTLFMEDSTWARIIFKDEERNNSNNPNYKSYRITKTQVDNTPQIPYRVINTDEE